MIKHKYQVFLSSTYRDLKDERRAAIDAILTSQHIPAGMEMFRGDDIKQKEIIHQWLKQIDIYILILGVRYGDIDPETGISYTEWEYDLAEELNIPRLVILLKDDYLRSKEYDISMVEINLPQYKSFKDRLTKEHYVHFVSSMDELKYVISTNIDYIIQENREHLKGWIEGTYEGVLSQVLNKDTPYDNVIRDWGMNYIFRSRAEKNTDSDPKLKDFGIKQLDGIAFGLKTFRSFHSSDIEQCLRNGMSIRLLTMDPNGEFIRQREREEHEVEGQISNSIYQLVDWGKDLKEKTGGDIAIRFYKSMTLDFYWRIGDCLYVGPYLYGKASQATITYKYTAGGKGFDMYTQYFDDLWNDNQLVQIAL